MCVCLCLSVRVCDSDGTKKTTLKCHRRRKLGARLLQWSLERRPTSSTRAQPQPGKPPDVELLSDRDVLPMLHFWLRLLFGQDLRADHGTRAKTIVSPKLWGKKAEVHPFDKACRSPLMSLQAYLRLHRLGFRSAFWNLWSVRQLSFANLQGRKRVQIILRF